MIITAWFTLAAFATGTIALPVIEADLGPHITATPIGGVRDPDPNILFSATGTWTAIPCTINEVVNAATPPAVRWDATDAQGM